MLNPFKVGQSLYWYTDPILTLSSLTMAWFGYHFLREADRDACLAAGMNDFLAKPFEQSHLLTKLQHWSRQ